MLSPGKTGMAHPGGYRGRYARLMSPPYEVVVYHNEEKGFVDKQRLSNAGRSGTGCTEICGRRYGRGK